MISNNILCYVFFILIDIKRFFIDFIGKLVIEGDIIILDCVFGESFLFLDIFWEKDFVSFIGGL